MRLSGKKKKNLGNRANPCIEPCEISKACTERSERIVVQTNNVKKQK